MHVRGAISCALGCPYQGEVAPEAVGYVARLMCDIGVQHVGVADTIGVGTPAAVQRAMAAALAVYPVADVSGTSTTPTGRRSPTSTRASSSASRRSTRAHGLGGCPYAKGATGNVATEDVVYMLHGLGIETGIDLAKLREAGRFIAAHLGRPPARAPGARSTCARASARDEFLRVPMRGSRMRPKRVSAEGSPVSNRVRCQAREDYVSTATGPDHGVEDGQELAHAGDEGHLGALACGSQALVMGADGRIAGTSAQGGHVQHIADIEATTWMRRVRERCRSRWPSGDADQGADFAPVQSPKFRQGSDQGSAGDRPDTFGGAQQRIEFGVVFVDLSLHLSFDIVELVANGGDHGLDAGPDLGTARAGAGARSEHGQQLSPAGDQGGQFLLLASGGGRRNRARSSGAPRRRPAPPGPRHRCGRSCQPADTLGEVARCFGLTTATGIPSLAMRRPQALVPPVASMTTKLTASGCIAAANAEWPSMSLANRCAGQARPSTATST